MFIASPPYIALVMCALRSFRWLLSSLFLNRMDRDQKQKRKKRDDLRDIWTTNLPMFVTFNSTTKSKKADTRVNEGLYGGEEKINKYEQIKENTQISNEHEGEESSTKQDLKIDGNYSHQRTHLISDDENDLNYLQGELERLRSQVKRESELRGIAEENLQMCQVQLRKEQETIHILRKKVVGLETKLYSEQPIVKLPDDWSSQDR